VAPLQLAKKYYLKKGDIEEAISEADFLLVNYG
jgi:hypothetical protein